MKVFLATLFIVGFAAAVPCPILKKLKTQLQQGVLDIRAHTDQLFESSGAKAKVDIGAFVKNPSKGSNALKKLLVNDARTVILTSTSNVNEMNKNIRTAISELKQVDPRLVKAQVYPILNNLRKQLVDNARLAVVSVMADLKESLSIVDEDTKAFESKPEGDPKILEKWNGRWIKFVNEGNQYVAKVQQLVQDALDGIEKQYGQ